DVNEDIEDLEDADLSELSDDDVEVSEDLEADDATDDTEAEAVEGDAGSEPEAEPEEAAPAQATEKKGPGEDESFVIGDDDEDAPAQQIAAAGATADPVKDYLKQIGKVPLLNAEQEVELAKRIEAGLFAEEKLALERGALEFQVLDDLEWI